MEKGLSFYICFGKYAGFGLEGDIRDRAFRLVLGWVSFGCLPVDIECTLMKLISERQIGL